MDVSTIWAIRETVSHTDPATFLRQEGDCDLTNDDQMLIVFQFVGIISVNAPILGPWIIRKCSFLAQTVVSKDQSSSEGNTKPKGFSIVTIGRKGYRLDHLKKDGKRPNPPGWTTINDSEESIIVAAQAGTGNAATLTNEAAYAAAMNKV